MYLKSNQVAYWTSHHHRGMWWQGLTWYCKNQRSARSQRPSSKFEQRKKKRDLQSGQIRVSCSACFFSLPGDYLMPWVDRRCGIYLKYFTTNNLKHICIWMLNRKKSVLGGHVKIVVFCSRSIAAFIHCQGHLTPLYIPEGQIYHHIKLFEEPLDSGQVYGVEFQIWNKSE